LTVWLFSPDGFVLVGGKLGEVPNGGEIAGVPSGGEIAGVSSGGEIIGVSSGGEIIGVSSGDGLRAVSVVAWGEAVELLLTWLGHPVTIAAVLTATSSDKDALTPFLELMKFSFKTFDR
jgi:hypothetical protein